MYLSERLNRNVSVMARHIRLCKIDTSPTYPFRYHCCLSAEKRMYESRTHYCHPSSLIGVYSSISLFHTIKKTFWRYAKFPKRHGITVSLSETGFSGFLIRLFLRRFANRLSCGRDYHLPHHYRPSCLLAISPMARFCLKNKSSERIEVRALLIFKNSRVSQRRSFFITLYIINVS